MKKICAILVTLTSTFGHAIIAPDTFEAPKLTRTPQGIKVEVQLRKSDREREAKPWATVTKKVTSLGKELDIQGNNVKIPEETLCAVIKHEGQEIIVCESQTFYDVEKYETGLTASPSHLRDPNYIGSYISTPYTEGLYGSGKRTVFLKK